MGCIYMRTSPSGKSYIGQTSFQEEKRWKEHCNIAFLKSSPGYNYPLSRAIRKYGPDNFSCIILEDNIEDVNILHEREMYWINYYDTFRHGLNATMGGEGNKIIDDGKIKELWDAGHCVRDICLLLDIWPSTALNNLDISIEECQKRGPIYKTKNSLKYLGDFQTGRAMPVSCFDMETGELIKSFQSFYQAAKFVGVNKSTVIWKAADGKIKSAYGYYWMRGDGITKLPKQVMEDNKTRHKVVKKYVVCVETNKMYSDTICAQKHTGINYRGILHVCHGYQNTAGGFHWRYATDADKEILTLISGEKRKYKNYNQRAVKCIETGVVYSSMKQASQETGANATGISKCCKHEQETSNGLHWEFYIEQGEHQSK